MYDENQQLDETPNWNRKLWGCVLFVVAFLIGGLAWSRRDGPPQLTEIQTSVPAGVAAAPAGVFNPPSAAQPEQPNQSQTTGAGREQEEQRPMRGYFAGAVEHDLNVMFGLAGNGQQTQSPPVRHEQPSSNTELRRLDQKKHEAMALREELTTCLAEIRAGKPECAKKYGFNPDTGQIDQSKMQSIIANIGSGGTSLPSQTQPPAALESPAGTMMVRPGTRIEASMSEDQVSSVASSPVKFLVSRPVYSNDRKYILIPKGSEITGEGLAGQSVDEILDPRLGFRVRFLWRPGEEKVTDASSLVPSGQNGLGGIEADLKWPWKAWGVGLFASILTATPSYALGGVGAGFGDPTQQLASGVASQVRGIGAQFVSRWLQAMPTKHAEGPVTVVIKTNNPIYLAPYKAVDKTEYEAIP